MSTFRRVALYDHTADDYRRIVRDANEVARKRFVDVPPSIAEDYRKAKREGKQTLPKFAAYGSYPLLYGIVQGPKCGIYCARCAYELIHEGEGAHIVADANWEDPELYCSGCSERIESAYVEKS